MKHSKLKVTILAAIGLTAVQANALGLVALPDTGFTNSAYTNCYNDGRVVPPTGADDVKGNFGSYPIASANRPSSSKNNTCYITPPLAEGISPVAGYSLVGFRTNTIPATTGGSGNIGTLVEYVWRNAANTMCLFGARVTMINSEHGAYNPLAPYFIVNDIARGGFANSGTVNVGYTIFSTSILPVYRIGRTFTSVQHRAYKYDTLANKALNGINYLDLPTKNSVTANITGEIYPIADHTVASTTLSMQDAAVNANWIDFTTKAVFAENDGATHPLSAFIYVEAACDSSNPNTWVKSGAIRLRQTGQDLSGLKEIAIDGFAPPGATLP